MESTFKEINDYLMECFDQMPVLNAICNRTVSKDELREIAKVHYAETKTFINVKNPARLYLCPHEANVAKKYFCFLYREEQGNFKKGKNHADLLKPVCFDLGLSEEEIEACYEEYRKSYLYLFQETPSMEVMIRELGVSVAWESLTPHFGARLVDALRDHYQLSEEALHYFTLHYIVDQGHSKQAIKTLAHYCTNDRMLNIAKNSIRASLLDEVHLEKLVY